MTGEVIYNTGNPVPSADAYDRHDNTRVFDSLLNGPDLTVTGRTGKVLKSWAGFGQQVTDFLIDSSYESVYLTYGAGVVVERQTQLVQRDGELYRVINAADIPLTLTGTWATDAPKLQAVGDAALRQALAAAGGAGLVEYDPAYIYPLGSVGADLRELDDLVKNQSPGAYARKNALLLGSALNKLRSGVALKIACQGDSMTAGYDTVSPDKIPPTNGDVATHAPIQYPSAMQFLLVTATGVAHIVQNFGYSGDTAKASYDRWVESPSADVAHVMLGTNDGDGVGGATLSEYLGYMEKIIRRYIGWGTGVVIHTTTPRGFQYGGQKGPIFTQALRSLAKLYSCPVFESDTVVQYAAYAGIYSDNTHFNAHGYNKYGNAVASFVLAGGWAMAPRMVSGEMQVPVGNGYEGIGFTSRNLVVSYASTGAYETNRSVAGFTQADDRITYTFFMDTEYMDVYAVGSLSGLAISCSFLANPQYEGDIRGALSRNRPVIRSQRNRGVYETTGYIFSDNRSGHIGSQTLIGQLVGRGWKTITIWAASAPPASRYLAGIVLKERDQVGMYRPVANPGDVGELSGAVDEVYVYQHPYIRQATSPLPVPSAAALPSIVYLPCPIGLLPAKSPSSSYFDSIPAEVTITGPAAFVRVILRRTTATTTLTISKISGDAGGDALIPTAAEFVYQDYDEATEAPTGSYVSGFASGRQNQYLKISFGSTPAGYYTITLRGPSKSYGSHAHI